MLPNKPDAQNFEVKTNQLVKVIQQQVGLESNDTESQSETLLADEDAREGQPETLIVVNIIIRS